MKKLLRSLFLLGFFLFVVSCSKEKVERFEPVKAKLFQREYTLKNYSNPFIRKNLVVEWANYSVNRNFKNKITAYEFNTYFKAKSPVVNYVDYKLIVSKIGEGKWRYEIIKFSPTKANIDSEASYFSIGHFTGSLYHYNLEGKNTSIEVYKKGQIIDSVSFDNDAAAKAPPIGGHWVPLVTFHYVDWYTNKGGGATLTYSHSTYTGSTSEWVYVQPSGNYHGMPYDREDEAYHNHYPHGGGGPNHDNENIVKKNFEERIDDANLDDCLKGILNNLKGHNHGVGKFIEKFAGNDPNYNWRVLSSSLPQYVTGQTDPPSKYDKINGTITTKFNSQNYPQATDLFWAGTILHEAVHAYLVSYYSTERENWIASYPEMVEDWGKFQNWNDVHHEEFARTLVADIATILKEYGMSKGYELSNDFYKALAWGGLESTSTFNSLPKAKQEKIKDIIRIELTGKDSKGNNKTQKGNDANC